MQRIRVLHTIAEMGTGGAESLVVEMARRGHQVGWQSAVASDEGCKVPDLIDAGATHFTVPAPRRSIAGIARAQRSLKRAIRSFEPDIVIAHNVSATVVARAARPGAPVLTVFHGVTGADYRNAVRVLSIASNRIVTVGDVIAGRLTGAGLRHTEVSVIRNAVTPPRSVDQRAARSALGIPAGQPVALCLARMEPQKRHDVLIDAWSQLSGGELLLLAGDGSLRAKLEEQARGLGSRIRFLGSRSDVPELLAAADVTVLTSDWEGLPIAVLESLAAGRPVVATDVDGVREILASGGGRLVPPRDVGSLVVALTEMLGDEGARSRAATIGSSTIAESYDPDKMMEAYDHVVGEMLSKEELCIP